MTFQCLLLSLTGIADRQVFSIMESRLRATLPVFSASMACCPLKIVPWQPRVPGVP